MSRFTLDYVINVETDLLSTLVVPFTSMYLSLFGENACL